MTERVYGHKKWYGQVFSVDDPDKEGRVQVRIYGLYDDTTNIANTDLPWVKPHQDITSAAHQKVGLTPVGCIPGSIVTGYFEDEDQQIPIFHATIAKAGNSPDQSQGQ